MSIVCGKIEKSAKDEECLRNNEQKTKIGVKINLLFGEKSLTRMLVCDKIR